MLQALSQLGKIEDKYESTPNIKHIIGMVFDSGKYIESKLYDFNASEYSKYLYEGHDASGKPGLFLTGNIPLQDVKNLSDANTHSEFIRKKILWFSHGKLVKNPRLFQTLSDQRQWELKSIFKELEDKHEQISRDVIYILTHNLPEQILLTTMIGQQFVGQIQDYVDFFNKGILNKKGIEEQLVCNACNKLNLVAPYTERSLPFFFSDKIHFFDNGNITRSFPICDECYQSLQNGIKFVNNRMNYNISSTSRLIQTKGQKKKQKSTATNIKFWLIPFVNNPEIVGRFKHNLASHNKQLYYLDSLKDLCNSLKLIQTYDFDEQQDYVDAFLRFSALFYYNDNKAAGLMRPLNYVTDIFPSQLRKLLEVKQRIDNLYPFLHIKKQELFVGFPLLVGFYKDLTPRWQIQVIAVLNKLFTGQRLSTDQLIQNINLRIHETLRYSRDLQIISRIALSGLMLLEYIITLNNTDAISISRSEGIMLKISIYEIEHTERFIENHKSVLSDETKQGIFAAGISVAMLLDFQERKYNKTAPFWDTLSRLDLNLQKVYSLIPKVKRLFGAYKNRDHDTFINYLAAKYVIDTSESISKDLASYLFTLGLSFGYLLARKNLVDNREEETKTQ
ncbi:MAG: TM1802 family CRISPR-associated protein [Nitrososphaeraceae archaeon]